MTPSPGSTGLGRVLWIGGGSGAGKSTIAARLAAAIGARVYSTDDAMGHHARRVSRDDAPLLDAFLGMSMDERWVDRPPAVMLDTFPWFAGEGFDEIVADLAGLDGEGPVIAEGFRLLPRLVAPLLDDPRHAVWLLPTPGFRAAAFRARRGSASDVPSRTSDPGRALANLLERDGLFTDRLAQEVDRLGLTAVTVDAGMGVPELTREIGAALGLPPSGRGGLSSARIDLAGPDRSPESGAGRGECFFRVESAVADDTDRRGGMFGLLRDLRRSGRLAPADADRARTLVARSYALHSEPPPEAYPDGAISWFIDRPSAAGVRALCDDVSELLARHGILTRTVRIGDPGDITYADDVQVVAVPRSPR